METVHTHVAMNEVTATKAGNFFTRMFSQQVAYFEQNRFAVMAMLMIAQSCVGSIACMHVLQYDPGYMTLAVCVFVTMGANALFIAQTSAKSCVLITYASLIINTLLIILV